MPAPLRFAVIGVRHSHILALINVINQHADAECVAICEPDDSARSKAEKQHSLKIAYTDVDQILANVDCDAVAVGDAYGNRGRLAQHILKTGRHVLSDKPICTRLDELNAIEKLVDATNLCIGCQLDLRDAGPIRTLRRVVREGRIGQVHTMTVLAQHPLNRAVRPGWYFQPDMHGGTINDILIHAFDAIPWLTNRRITDVVAARAWNARTSDAPHFQDGAQVMLRLDNGGGVLADASYLAPEGAGYSLPQYWRMTVHGDTGMAETSINADAVMLAPAGEPTVQSIPAEPANPAGYFKDFLADIAGNPRPDGVTTDSVLKASRLALTAQQHADSTFHATEP